MELYYHPTNSEKLSAHEEGTNTWYEMNADGLGWAMKRYLILGRPSGELKVVPDSDLMYMRTGTPYRVV